MSFQETFAVYVLHWVPEKAIYIGGHSLPWDARCSGIYVGIGFGFVWLLFTAIRCCKLPKLPILCLNTIMFLPMIVDITTLWFKLRAPSNDIRYLTGLMFGSSLSMYAYPVFVSILSSNSHEKSCIDTHKKYVFFLISLVLVFFLKSLDNNASFLISYGLAVFGFVGIFTILLINSFVLFFRR